MIPIHFDSHFAVGSGGMLELRFQAAWNSTISFDAGIPVALGGTLNLHFTPDVDVSSQLGRTYRIFDWISVNPNGSFAISSPYTWNLSNLYTTGEATLIAVPEPSTLVLMIFPASGWYLSRRRAA